MMMNRCSGCGRFLPEINDCEDTSDFTILGETVCSNCWEKGLNPAVVDAPEIVFDAPTEDGEHNFRETESRAQRLKAILEGRELNV
jgi:recombinational DNA repair protein (RecF pathway)